MPTERYVQGKLLPALHKRGGYWVKFVASGYSRSGVPDIIGCYRGIFVAFELKNQRYKNRPVKALSPEQVSNLQDIINNDGIAAVITSIDEAMAILDKIDAALGPALQPV